MKVGSLFSGTGGFDLGLERAGMEIVSQCEWDEFRRDILRRHWPNVACFPDVSEINGRRGACDLLVGGFPCQDLSVAGRRAGLDGARSGLFFEFARVADECIEPGGWILIENVPGLLSSKDGRDFGVLLGTLVDLGFHDLAWRVLDSRYFGVPQRRRRVFILARRARGTRAREVLLEPEGGFGHPEEGRKARSKASRKAGRGTEEAGEGVVGGSSGGRAGGTPGSLNPQRWKALDPGAAFALDRQCGQPSQAHSANLVVEGFASGGPAHWRESDEAGVLSARQNKDHGNTIVASALDRMRGGADDNDAQAHHIVPSGMVHGQGLSAGDPDVASTLGARGKGGGETGIDRDGAYVVPRPIAYDDRNNAVSEDVHHTLRHDGGTRSSDAVCVPTLRSGNTARNNSNPVTEAQMLVYDEQNSKVVDDVGTLSGEGLKRQNRGFLVAEVEAATLTSGSHGGKPPSRRREDDENVVAFNVRGRDGGSQAEIDGDGLASVRAADGGSSRSYVSATGFDRDQRMDSPEEGSSPPLRGHRHSAGNACVSVNPWAMTVDEDNVAKTLLGGNSDHPSINDASLVAADGAAGFNPQTGGSAPRLNYREGEAPALQKCQMAAVHITQAKAIWENQQAHVWETDYTNPMSTGGGKTGQGYASAHIEDSEGNHFVRRLTPTECERLQGFPDGWTFPDGPSLRAAPSWYEVAVTDGGFVVVPEGRECDVDRAGQALGYLSPEDHKPDGRRYSAMGDAVTVPVIEWIGRRLLRYGAD